MSKKPFVSKEKLDEIAAQYATPFYLYDEAAIRETFNTNVENRTIYLKNILPLKLLLTRQY